ncbi:enoyl-CoA hydratase/isomerase family protein [Actinomadura sp. NEAU-AAG7]|uniref:enoyl-CoA hydratase/isomerase family protein n=1 Tax=Actinomadura sp. NEAU-AAG7 TaxID=2839640 RepID=UPI001BE4C6A9|nr:enoyl-CoA hydratase/isomerase family protein [Actinomadura sp. NEAU-AAG7]MBT2211756.1 enoyl-CoA hydratase/isomerase family protein [Actinomadura sp. NEAU-AAG7]
MTDASAQPGPEPANAPGPGLREPGSDEPSLDGAGLGGTPPSGAALAEAGLRLEVDGAVATVTLNRPERRNAMTFAMWRGLAAIGRSLPDAVRVVVLKGAGPSFSAGIDLTQFSEHGFPDGADAEATDRFIAELQDAYTWPRRPEIVTIAAVHGHAIGGGFQLALACDLRVIADDTAFCMKEPALGLVPDLTGTKPLVEAVGLPRALELCLTARTVHAEEAARLGLAETLVPRGALDGAVADLVAALLAVDAGAAVATKRLLRQAPANTLEQQCAAERREQIGRFRALFAAR